MSLCINIDFTFNYADVFWGWGAYGAAYSLEEGVVFPEAGVIDGYEPPNIGAENPTQAPTRVASAAASACNQ